MTLDFDHLGGKVDNTSTINMSTKYSVAADVACARQ
jgi:hypothetical protein